MEAALREHLGQQTTGHYRAVYYSGEQTLVREQSCPSESSLQRGELFSLQPPTSHFLCSLLDGRHLPRFHFAN